MKIKGQLFICSPYLFSSLAFETNNLEVDGWRKNHNLFKYFFSFLVLTRGVIRGALAQGVFSCFFLPLKTPMAFFFLFFLSLLPLLIRLVDRFPRRMVSLFSEFLLFYSSGIILPQLVSWLVVVVS